MTWARFSDDWFTSPEIIVLSDKAKVLAFGAVTYIARHLTDGVVPKVALNAYTTGKVAPAIAELVACGLFVDRLTDVYVPSWGNHSGARNDVLESLARKAHEQSQRRSCSSGDCYARTGHSHSTQRCPERGSHVAFVWPVPIPSIPVPSRPKDRDRDRDMDPAPPTESSPDPIPPREEQKAPTTTPAYGNHQLVITNVTKGRK